jgi:hypothetical protein
VWTSARLHETQRFIQALGYRVTCSYLQSDHTHGLFPQPGTHFLKEYPPRTSPTKATPYPHVQDVRLVDDGVENKKANDAASGPNTKNSGMWLREF